MVKAKTKAVLLKELEEAKTEIDNLNSRIENISLNEILEKKIKIIVEDMDLPDEDRIMEIASEEAQNIIDGATISA